MPYIDYYDDIVHSKRNIFFFENFNAVNKVCYAWLHAVVVNVENRYKANNTSADDRSRKGKIFKLYFVRKRDNAKMKKPLSIYILDCIIYFIMLFI